jgi:plasmid stabilization system protein ParE
MPTEIRWLPKAERDLSDIAAYYRHISPSLVTSFDREVERILTQLREFPLTATAVTPTLRRYCLSQFPFAVYYRSSSESLTVAAVLPQRADPRWINRTLSSRRP